MRTRFAYAAALQLLVWPGVALSQTAPQPPKAPVLIFAGRIPLGIDGRIDHTSIDLRGQRLFSSVFGADTVAVIDLKTNKVINQIKGLNKPQNSFYVPDVNRLFVSNQGDGTVRIFDGTNFALQKTVKLSSDADNIRYDARRKHVLVDYGGEKFLRGQVQGGTEGRKDGAVAVFDLNGNKVADIPTSGHPESLQLEQKGNRIFINSPDNHYVVVADLDTNKVLAHWDTPGCENYPMALDEEHHRIYVFCRNSPGYVIVIDTESGKQVAKIPATPESTSDDMYYDAGKGRLYVMSSLQQVPGEPGVIDVIQQRDADHYERIATYPSGPTGRDGLLVPELGKLFVSTPRQTTGQGGELLIYDTK